MQEIRESGCKFRIIKLKAAVKNRVDEEDKVNES